MVTATRSSKAAKKELMSGTDKDTLDDQHHPKDDKTETVIPQQERPAKKPRRTVIMNAGGNEEHDVTEGGGGGGGSGGGNAPAAGAAPAPFPAPVPVPATGTAASAGRVAGAARGPPQVYDGAAVAATVFEDPYFYMTEDDADNHRMARKAKLGNLSVRDVLETFYNNALAAAEKKKKSWDHPLQALSDAIGAGLAPIDEYYNTADMETKAHFAGIVLRAMYKGEFKERTVKIGAALDPLLMLDPLTAVAEAAATTATGTANEPQGRTINMEFLNCLRLDEKDERFLIPATVYVRDCMRLVFGLFREDVEGNAVPPKSNSTVLIGSPGVGKSILFFLAALYQARKRRVVYFRITKTKQEEVSLFFMRPVPGDPASVHVWFSRNMDKEAINKLSDVRFDLERELGIRREEYYAYIDGPNHKQKEYLMAGMYDYFCTSGGVSYVHEPGAGEAPVDLGWLDPGGGDRRTCGRCRSRRKRSR